MEYFYKPWSDVTNPLERKFRADLTIGNWKIIKMLFNELVMQKAGLQKPLWKRNSTLCFQIVEGTQAEINPNF